MRVRALTFLLTMALAVGSTPIAGCGGSGAPADGGGGDTGGNDVPTDDTGGGDSARTEAGGDVAPEACGATCTSDNDCSDGVYCNGTERCAPQTAGANCRGCVSAASPPCVGDGGLVCVEAMQSCVRQGCATVDEYDHDRDGVRAVRCGGNDCDDNDPQRFPGNGEHCDDHDEDCDPCTVADPNSNDGDSDGDGFVSTACSNPFMLASQTVACDPIRVAVDLTNRVVTGRDCDDSTATGRNVRPNQVEQCNGIDDNCNGQTDEGFVPQLFYPDDDDDGYGSNTAAPISTCAQPPHTALNRGDCDDTRSYVNPGGSEVCDGLDDNCNGRLDAPGEDQDLDGHASYNCPVGGSDCNDNDPSVYVGAPERCDGVDSDCDGQADTADADAATACGTRPNETAACAGSGTPTCQFSCNPGFVDCDGSSANGCEISVQTDAQNCGACGFHCTPGQACAGGVCQSSTHARVISANANGACSVRPNGSVECWGNGTQAPVVIPTFTNSVEVALTGTRVCARDNAGTIRCADPTGSNPVTVTTPARALDLVCGATTACARGADGKVYCNLNTASVWTEIASLQGTTALAADDSYVCGVGGNGSVKCARLSGGAASTVSGITDAVALAGRFAPICVVRATGGVVCGIDPGATAAAVPSLSNVAFMDTAGGSFQSCARLQGGSVVCWGSNGSGELGNGTTTASTTPVTVTAATGAVDVATGNGLSCAQMPDTSVLCWGNANNGQLGTAVPLPWFTSPRAIPGLTGVTEVAAGADRYCVRAGGQVYCHGQYPGDGSNMSRVPVRVSGITDATNVQATYAYACALRSGNVLSCWGGADYGELGNGSTTTNALTPTNVIGITGTITSFGIASGGGLVLLGDNTVETWGTNDSGQLGNGVADYLNPRPSAAAVPGLSGVTAIFAGGGSNAALRLNGDVLAWGRYDSSGAHPSPTLQGSLPPSSELSYGYGICTRNSSGTVPCIAYFGAPVTLATGLTDAANLGNNRSYTGGHRCVLRTNGTVACWGSNVHGQLGDGTTVDRTDPTPVPGLTGVTSVSTSGDFSCAAAGGQVYCWGYNGANEFGNDAPAPRSTTPVAITGL